MAAAPSAPGKSRYVTDNGSDLDIAKMERGGAVTNAGRWRDDGLEGGGASLVIPTLARGGCRRKSSMKSRRILRLFRFGFVRE